MLTGDDLVIFSRTCGNVLFLFTYHRALRPVYAMVRSFSSPACMICNGIRSPESNTARPRGNPLYSRNWMGQERSFFNINLGEIVITFVSLYLPSPSVHDNPKLYSSFFCFVDGITISASAAGASRLNTFNHQENVSTHASSGHMKGTIHSTNPTPRP